LREPLLRRVEYVELSGQEGFNEAFLTAVRFPELEEVT
jgi:hypothetical protein